MDVFNKLLEYNKDTIALQHVAGRLSWDQETMMPSASICGRVEELAAINKVLYKRNTSNQLQALIEGALDLKLKEVDRRHVYLISRVIELTKRVPQDLTIALARLTPKARQIWAHSRQSGDVSTFLTVL